MEGTRAVSENTTTRRVSVLGSSSRVGSGRVRPVPASSLSDGVFSFDLSDPSPTTPTHVTPYNRSDPSSGVRTDVVGGRYQKSLFSTHWTL